MQFDIKEKDKTHTLYFVGKRVWIETYRWEKSQLLYNGEVKSLSDYIESENNIKQNNFAIWIMPLLIGILIRSVFIRWEKGYIVSCGFILISIAVWIWTKHLVSHGIDGTVMLLAWMTTILTVASLITGGISLLIKKSKR